MTSGAVALLGREDGVVDAVLVAARRQIVEGRIFVEGGVQIGTTDVEIVGQSSGVKREENKRNEGMKESDNYEDFLNIDS